jgi:non-specific serine/threonine protein kinase
VVGTPAPAFGALLRAARLAAGLSQEALAASAGVAVRTVSDLERGINHAPRRETLEALARTLQLAPGERAAWETAWRAAQDAGTVAGGPLSGNLPVPPNQLIGRNREVDDLVALLRDDDARLITVTGPGGVGKTRLALEAARKLVGAVADGTWLVELGPVRDPELVPGAVADVLGVREAGRRPLLETLTEALRGRELLLVLDNCEHLLASAPAVAVLLAACPSFRVLATSRERLHLTGERAFPLGPLPLPPVAGPADDADGPASSPAVTLFVERARAARPDFALAGESVAAVVEVCRRLDGLPLAIELAAAWAGLLPPSALLRRLQERRLPLAGGARDLPERQQTLWGTIGWSHALLGPSEQTLFRRLAAFPGDFSLEAAEAVCDRGTGGELLAGLRELTGKSLLQARPATDGEPRFGMLETIRDFARERLEVSDDAPAARARHAAFYLDLAERGRAHLVGPDRLAWLERLEREQHNFRAAMQHTMAVGQVDIPVRFSRALTQLWLARGQLSEGLSWLERGLEQSAGATPAVRAAALHGAGYFAGLWGDHDRAAAWLREAAALLREQDDRAQLAQALANLGRSLWMAGKADEAFALLEEAVALASEAGHTFLISYSLLNLAAVALDLGLDARAAELIREGMGLGPDPHTGAYGALLSAFVACERGETVEARGLARRGLEVLRAAGDTWGALVALLTTSYVAARSGDDARAVRLLSAATRLESELGVPAPPPLRARAQKRADEARERMGEAAFEAAWADGARQTLADSVADAVTD